MLSARAWLLCPSPHRFLHDRSNLCPVKRSLDRSVEKMTSNKPIFRMIGPRCNVERIGWTDHAKSGAGRAQRPNTRACVILLLLPRVCCLTCAEHTSPGHVTQHITRLPHVFAAPIYCRHFSLPYSCALSMRVLCRITACKTPCITSCISTKNRFCKSNVILAVKNIDSRA